MDAYLVAMLAAIYAEYARIAGMQAENDRCKAVGARPVYDERHFFGAASQLDQLSLEVRQRG